MASDISLRIRSSAGPPIFGRTSCSSGRLSFDRPGDILIATSSGSRDVVGKSAQIKYVDTLVAFGAFCAVARPRFADHSNYLQYYLRSSAYRRYVENVALAININNFRTSDLFALPLPLSPIQEQRRIVAKLDRLFERTRRARQELYRIPLLIDHYKKAILSAAFRGDLTADWRIRHGMPDKWPMESVGAAIADIRYGTSKKCFLEPHGTAILRIPNVTSDGIDTTDLKYTNLTRQEIEKLSLQLGDLLVVRSNGSVDLVGQSVVVENDIVGYAYAGYLIRLRPKPNTIDPRFLRWMLSCPQTRRTIEVNARSTSGVHNINSEELQALLMPLPSLEEQKEAVRLIAKSFDWLATVSDEVAKSNTLLEHLDQANVGKAFRGKLVPQDPNDEPASVLLERIRSQPKPKQGRRKIRSEEAVYYGTNSV